MPRATPQSKDPSPPTGGFQERLERNIVLVGLMGAGKTCIGRRLAQRLSLPFRDADNEVEKAAGCSVEEIFARHGEAHFRDGERRVITRLLESAPLVLATGGGAYMDPRTRTLIRKRGVAIWLQADLPLLLKRTSRRNNRPLLKTGDPRSILEGLIEKRYPVYAQADIVVESVDGPPEITVERAIEALSRYFEAHPENLEASAAPLGEDEER